MSVNWIAGTEISVTAVMEVCSSVLSLVTKFVSKSGDIWLTVLV